MSEGEAEKLFCDSKPLRMPVCGYVRAGGCMFKDEAERLLSGSRPPRWCRRTPPLMSKCDGTDAAHDEDSEMSTTDVSGDTADGNDSDSDGPGSANAEAAAVDTVIAAVVVADSVDQVEEIVDNFLADAGTISNDAALRIDMALQERTNDVYFDKLQESLYAGPVAVELVEALSFFGPGDWGKSP